MIDLVEQPYKCVHCGKSFMKDKTLVAHMCESKRRVLQKDEKRVQSGFVAFNRFYQLTQNAKKQKTYEEFCKSSFYNAFVKFGSFINNVGPLYPEKFIDYVIKSGVKLDHWCRDELYEKYLYETLKIEPVENAVQRTIQHMMDWADTSGASFEHYFLYVNLNRAVQDIRAGQITPWMILNCKSGKELLNKLNDEQLELITPALDIPFWLRKFKDHPADAILVKEICKEAGII
jgi:DNA-directed RNA polymerase subunit RPC12/RpoP